MRMLQRLNRIKNDRDEVGILMKAIILTEKQYYSLMREIKEIIGVLSDENKEYISFINYETQWKGIPIFIVSDVVDLSKEEI